MRRPAAIVLAAMLAVGGIAGPGAARAVSPGDAQVRQAGPSSAPVRTGDRLSAAGRWIVVLRSGSGAPGASAIRLRAARDGIAPDRVYAHALRGFAARLSPIQVAALRADPGVAAVIPDQLVAATGQEVPRGVQRIGGFASLVARIDGVDDRVDADVAIVDTGVAKAHEDLNVVGGISCSTDNPDSWNDPNGHGTHVAGTVAALDNGLGVVGVAPGARIWGVRILDAAGNGLVSWYVCGLDWIASQRDPDNPARPLIEVVNMSVARAGSDDGACGSVNGDVIHQAICRVVAGGTTVVAAAGNNSLNANRLIPASYDEVITVSALADTDGEPGGLGGSLCWSWSSWDHDDTFADFSNYGRDVDLIAPGKCTLSTLPGDGYGWMSGTSMAAPHVTGAAALYVASRPGATPAQVRGALIAAGTQQWATATDPDTIHEPLLDVSHIVQVGDWTLDATPAMPIGGLAPATGAALDLPVRLFRAEDQPQAIDLTVEAPAPLTATVVAPALAGQDAVSTAVHVVVPPGTAGGTYTLQVTATDGSRTRSSSVPVVVDAGLPVAAVPAPGLVAGGTLAAAGSSARFTWGSPTDAEGPIAAQQVRWIVDGVAGPASSLPVATRSITRTLAPGQSVQLATRAQDAAGNWSEWAMSGPVTLAVVQERAAGVTRAGRWRLTTSSVMSGGTAIYNGVAKSWAQLTFQGRSVAFVAPWGPRLGRARILVDGVPVVMVDLHAAAISGRHVVFARSWPADGSHVLRVEVSGTAGHPYVDVDAFLVLRSPPS